ncbi:hypothetical protein BDV96DRAFT_574176 [Lophiotrema nucula]|uniref:UmuC domain-containing protein n=1 Tax=Lophiotrema nucula TaxID=690887 RepID=A0A6A5ZAY1_9PLEO|nr:hypothetical protein BDV96DRAFT_574176 [Lophiotrema nucula]
MEVPRRKRLKRQLDSIIIHFDYDCFYASVFEHENPTLKTLPLAVQQKQIVVTCNYEARRRGLYKLQLISEAKKICPDVVIVLGEDLTRFRNASKELYGCLKAFSWNARVERLGFDEVFMDVSDIVDCNLGLLNQNDLTHSFFCLSKDDPAAGFEFDASRVAGHSYPNVPNDVAVLDSSASQNELEAAIEEDVEAHLHQRLILGSHLAKYLRHLLDAEKGYTCTVGISTNKLLAKLVGNLHKPNGQTTLLPPYISEGALRNHINRSFTYSFVSRIGCPLGKLCDSIGSTVLECAVLLQNLSRAMSNALCMLTYMLIDDSNNVTSFIDDHEVGKVPGIGFKLAQKIRTHVLQRSPEFDTGLVYGGTKEKISVGDVRRHPGMSPGLLEHILGGPGTPHGIGTRVWDLLNGNDDTEVNQAREVPKQISIEDSYIRLDTMEEVVKELRMLSRSLLKRMHTDLLHDEDEVVYPKEEVTGAIPDNPVRGKRWVSFPKTLRLSTRPRSPQNPDGRRNRSFARISRSGPMPNFAFSLKDSIDSLVERLVTDALIPLFRKLHPETHGWNLSLMNLAATNMVDAASDKGGVGRDISKMFRRQDEALKPFRVTDQQPEQPQDDMGVENQTMAPEALIPRAGPVRYGNGTEDLPTASQEPTFEVDMDWEEEEELMDDTFQCDFCSAIMPTFAMVAHYRWHEQGQ